jgi:hypothetical protein
MEDKPMLFVDVDGVISLWGFDSDRRPPGAFHAVDGVVHFLSEDAGKHLQALGDRFDLVWCTGWEEKANEHLVVALGLPGPLPFLELDRHREAGHTTPGHWKLGAVTAHAGDRPAAWIDDAFNEACHEWARRRSEAGTPTLLVENRPADGLTGRHAGELRAWAERLR